MELPCVPQPSANVLKKYKESSLEFLHHPPLPPPLGDGVQASDFHPSSIK